MMELLPVLVGVLLAQASPGPNMMAVAANALGSGRRAGIATAAGIANGVFVWAVLFSLGIGALLRTFPQTMIAMKLVGGGYLLYLGVRALYGVWSGGKEASHGVAPKVQLIGAFINGFLVVMTNPKAALMWVAIVMYLASTSHTAGQLLIVGLCASLSAMAIYGTYAVVFSTGLAMRAHRRFFGVIESLFGCIFGAAGAKLVVDGVREAHP